MSVATNDREAVAWAWPAVFLMFMLGAVGSVAYAAVWLWETFV
ncbi:hypothetical protein [Actinoplanes sp. NPDC089786]